MKLENKNIAMVVYAHYSRDARIRRYTEALARQDHKVDCICLAEKYNPKERNITLIHYPLPRKRAGKFWYISEYLLFFLYTTWILSKNHILKHYKVIHINNMPDILVFTAAVPKLLGTQIILDMHDPMPELYVSKYHTAENNFGVVILKSLERASFKFANLIITANDAFKSIFLKRNNIDNNKINVILNCPDPRIFKPEAKKDKRDHFTLFYMGTVDERFGLDIALEAIPNLVKHIPNLKFVIIPKLENEGEYFENLKRKIINSNLYTHVFIEPPIPLEVIAQKLKEADIGVVLAQNGVFTENIFPVKLLEFVQMNVPVIATKTKVLSRYFNGKQIYFMRKNTPEEFATAVIELYRNTKLRQNLTQNAREYLKQYNWPKEEKKYLHIINSLLMNIS